MASYTMELRECLSTLLTFDGVDVSKLSIKDLIEQGRQKLFNFDYEIFDPNYKAVWETNFIRNFYMREIGFETEGLFQFQLETWIRINMPYFNKLFLSETLKFDPLVNTEMTVNNSTNKDVDTTINSTTDSDSTKTNKQTLNGTEHKDISGTDKRDTTGTESRDITGTVNQDDTGTKNDTSFNRHLESETPDNRLQITTQDGVGVIEYASRIEEDTNKTTSDTTNSSDISTTNNVDVNTTNSVDGTTSNTIDGTTTNSVDGTNTDTTNISNNTTNTIKDVETYVSTRTGKVGSITYSEMVMKYRDSLIRVERKMFNEMQQLFMLVY